MKKITFLAILFLFIACTTKPIDKINWMAGNWHTTGRNSGYHETWTRNLSGNYLGNSYALQNDDTVYSEKLLIKKEGSEVVMRAANNDKDKQTAFNFKLTKATDYEAVFENPLNDFPNKITYRKMSDSTIIEVVTGKHKGKDVSNRMMLSNR